jgi:probable rRNA maturation factor
MLEIHIDQEFLALVDAGSLQSIASQVLVLTKHNPESELSLEICGDETLQNLNLEFMGIDAATDVLSFPIPFENPDSGNPYLGDVMISYPTAALQANTAGHSAMEEVKLLLVHGMLHLLGYDHTTPEEKQAMWAIQDSLLEALEIKARPTE